MHNFQCDYTEGAHKKIIDALVRTNMEQTPGYGMDDYCTSAREKIRLACNAPAADVHFLVGGTQTNTTVISSLLRPYQGAVSADAGHIAVHETGAIESTGHKVLCLKSENGKISAAQIENFVTAHIKCETAEHEVQPGMVYISLPTECGTLYSKKELSDIYTVCKKHDLPFYIDGARLGYGLADPNCDITLSDLAKLCDIFYIGGTKCGSLFGEAVVICNEKYKKDFRYMIKRHGGMFAKGRLLGIQFDTLFTDDLYLEITKGAVEKALRIREAFAKRGIKFFGASTSNQQFPILTSEQVDFLSKNSLPEFWCNADGGKKVVRFCTSWATTEESVATLISDIENMPE
ncbi:MAG: aminotransferase class V-fold PLP-dependent enzyme [Clostridia bacterium]|nr:aminotransferase class V-fold PLP-dependent enzyme [Clostridia bacterium]